MRPSQEIGSQKYLSWLLWCFVLLSLSGVAGNIWLSLIGCGRMFGDAPGFFLGGVGFLILGVLVVRNRPENRIGWLASLIGTQIILFSLSGIYTNCAEELPLPGISYVAWIEYVIAPYLLVSMFILLPQLFPNGRFLSPRWRGVTWTGLGIFTLSLIFLGLLPGEMIHSPIGIPSFQVNPFGLSFLPAHLFGPIAVTVAYITLLGSIIVAIASLITRWRRSQGDQRQQVKWIAYFLIVVLVYLLIFESIVPLFIYPHLSESVANYYDILYEDVMIPIIFTGFPLTIGIAVFKYRLYDIDIIIRRTLQYGLLTGLLALIYFGGVVLTQSVFSALTGNADSPLITVISTLAIVVLFTPLKTRAQNFIDRRFYRAKYDAEKTLAQFTAAARDEVDVEWLTGALLGVVEETMQPESASLWLMPTERKMLER